MLRPLTTMKAPNAASKIPVTIRSLIPGLRQLVRPARSWPLKRVGVNRKKLRATPRLPNPGPFVPRTAAARFRLSTTARVSEGEITKLCGWETRSMFDRYNIINEADLAAAVAKRLGGANGKPAANGDAPAQPSTDVSSTAS